MTRLSQSKVPDCGRHRRVPGAMKYWDKLGEKSFTEDNLEDRSIGICMVKRASSTTTLLCCTGSLLEAIEFPPPFHVSAAATQPVPQIVSVIALSGSQNVLCLSTQSLPLVLVPGLAGTNLSRVTRLGLLRQSPGSHFAIPTFCAFDTRR